MEGPPVSWAWGEGGHLGAQETLGVRSRRESGQPPLPRGQFPSPGQPAPVDGPAPPLLQCPCPRTQAWRPIAAPVAVAAVCRVCKSEKRLAEKGTQAPSPEAGAREEVCSCRDPPPGTGQDPRRCQVEPPEPRQRRHRKCAAVSTTAGRAAQGVGRGEPEHRAGGSGGDPLRFQDSHWTFKGRTPAGQWLMVVGPAPRSQASTERRRQAGLDPRAGLEEPQPQWPPQGPSPPSPEAPASTAGTGDQQRPCPQSVSSLTPPKGIPALSPQTPWEALPGVYPWPARLLSQDTPGWAPLTPPGMPSLSPQGGP